MAQPGVMTHLVVFVKSGYPKSQLDGLHLLFQILHHQQFWGKSCLLAAFGHQAGNLRLAFFKLDEGFIRKVGQGEMLPGSQRLF